MSRTISAALAAAIAQDITQVGYLVRLDSVGSPGATLRWCDLGNFYWPQIGSPPSGGDLYAAAHFSLSGIQLALDAPSPDSVTLTAQNLDNTMSALLLTTDLSQATVTLWQVARGLTAQEDAAQLGVFSVNGAEIGLRSARLSLVSFAANNLYAPRKRVDAAHGLANAIAAGTRIPWGNEVIVLEEDSDG